MTPQYQNYHKQAMDLQYHFHDVVDNHADPRMQALQHEVHGLVDDIKSEKNPQHVEDRLKVIQHQLDQARNAGGQGMSFGDLDSLHHATQQMYDNFRSGSH